MSFRSHVALCLILCTAAGLGGGCSGGKKFESDPDLQLSKAELGSVYELYLNYLKQNQKAPTQLADLTKPQYEGIAPDAVMVLRSGKYVVNYGAKLSKSGEGVVAYEKDAPKQGGAVVMSNGSYKKMSAEELQAALKNKG